MATQRALHFVLKVGDRVQSTHFYRNVLGMKFLRHEEFEEGCKASCNGPYEGKWSKSMVGYGPEDDHFVVELTYNYGLGTYKLGNDFQGFTINHNAVLKNAKKFQWPVMEESGRKYVEAPEGYRFYVVDVELDRDLIQKVTLSCSNLQKSVEFWNQRCGMEILSQDDTTALLAYSPEQCMLELRCVEEKIDHGTASGRIAYSCPETELVDLEARMQEAGETILTPLVSLDTPGKATVKVIIVADPDGHEICFVGDEAFRKLSQVDPEADALLDEAIAKDKSDEWFAKKGKVKGVAE